MASFEKELPNELILKFELLEKNTEEMMTEMTKAGAEVVREFIKVGMRESFKTTKSIEKGLKVTKAYRTPSDDGINTKVGFYGYTNEGIPIPLIVLAREFGTSRGERKKPFVRKAFQNKKEIDSAMKQVQKKYLKDD